MSSSMRESGVGSEETFGDELRRECVIVGRELIASDVVRLTLESVDGRQLGAWEPGAHIDLLLAGGTLIRQYSLCGDPRDRSRWQVAVLRTPDSRGGSKAVHDELSVGAIVEVGGPRNAFGLEDGPRYRFVAGGIGITPILPMIEALEARGADWSLIYGGRDRAAMAFLERLEALGSRVRIVPEDELGRIDVDECLAVDERTLVYCCGPSGLLDAVVERSAETAPGRLRVERFTAPPAASDEQDEGFVVVLERSGKTLEVGPDQSILDACLAAGVDVPCSCTEGICGTCETDVLEGVPLHRDHLLSPDERASNRTMMVCVSRAQSDRLVLDL